MSSNRPITHSLLNRLRSFVYSLSRFTASAVRAIRDAVAVEPGEPTYRLTQARMLRATGDQGGARWQLDELRYRDIGGANWADIAQLATRLSSMPPPTPSLTTSH
ncbi:hypothetical protein FHW69_000016 [Luteibacter sp. Sphag1AF]|uniref:hypothetical protein n=1 Tax=Luteibacter sp. Sphag1AF TaxID=2587031 RepID=UPI00161DAB84|nr:hypothetical protein [Luteibacter sp. Sphag1AF]MBB3225426.1 hypothetical protein [Luteibacter sp. Sphag1AF]